MGKRLIKQRRGRGTSTYRANSHTWKAAISHRKYDDQEKTGVITGKITKIFHCPGHTSPLATIKFENNESITIPAPVGIKVNDAISSGAKAELKKGNTLPLQYIPEGTSIYNIENKPADGGKLVRTAGTTATITTITKNKVTVMLPSKRERSLDPQCRATIGTIAGTGRLDKPFMKAGKKYHAMHARGKLYPKTSGVAMNAVDHPFGSGRGKHVGKPKTPSRFAPPGAKVGKIGARRTGKRK
jgi:large subunit ribosomal protein L2